MVDDVIQVILRSPSQNGLWSLSARNCRWLYCEHTDESDGAAMFFPHLHFEEKPEKKFALSESVLSPNHHAVPLQRQNHASILGREVEI